MADNTKTNKERKEEKQVCFVIMPFSDPEGYEKEHFRKVYEQIFKPAIEMVGFEAHRVDENNESTLIQAKIYEQLINAPLVLCDLSTKNPNVLYELGIRHAFDKPVVLVQEEGQSRIFDITGVTTVDYRKSRRYDEVLEDQRKIATALRETASSEKRYSFMSFVNLTSAIAGQHERISQEESVILLLNDLIQKFSKMESKIAGVASPDIKTIKLDIEDELRLQEADQCKKELQEINFRAEQVLNMIEHNKGANIIVPAEDIFGQLCNAISAYQKCDFIDSDVLRLAIRYRNQVKKILPSQKYASV